MKARLAHYLFSLGISICLPLAAATAAENTKRFERAEVARSETLRDSGTRADYILQPLDVLKVLVFQEEDINKQGEVRMTEESTITLPLIGSVNLRGKTVRQAEDLIRQLYDKDYLVKPQVTLNVVKYSERFVNVTGAVNKPDRVPFPQERGLTIVSAISLAGGQSRLANLKKVSLTRRKPDGEQEKREIDVDAIINGKGGEDIPLQPEDSIFVPERIL
jgi:polysaccharide export outer membrane protein